MNSPDLRVLVVARDALSRAGLSTLLSNHPGCVVVGQVADDYDIAEAAGVYQPDVVVWDLGWEPASSIEQLAELATDTLDTLPVLALLPNEAHAAEVWNAGIRGLALREASVEDLIAALNAIRQGLVVLAPELVPALTAAAGTPSPAAGVAGLTARELEVLRLLSEGLPNKTIAARLSISEHTVKFHVNAILGKLGAQSRTEAVSRATRLGLIVL